MELRNSGLYFFLHYFKILNVYWNYLNEVKKIPHYIRTAYDNTDILKKGCTHLGLFMNNEQHHGIYISSERINEQNQATFRKDHLAELLKEQQKTYETLYKSMLKLGIQHKQQDTRQLKQWQEVSDRLSGLENVYNQQSQQTFQMIEKLKRLTDDNETLQMMMENKRISDQRIIDQIRQDSLTNQELLQQVIEQSENQQEVSLRLENQEALMEKALRQIDNLRSSLFERTNFLAETIEDSYKLTSSYLYQLLTGADQPLTFYMSGEKKREKEKEKKGSQEK